MSFAVRKEWVNVPRLRAGDKVCRFVIVFYVGFFWGESVQFYFFLVKKKKVYNCR